METLADGDVLFSLRPDERNESVIQSPINR